MRGELSDIFFADAARRLEDIIADYELQTISDTGHFPPMEKPQASANLILDFVHRKIKSI
jgi:pimeloyl-ACP methyl ester carboxylesterase